MADFFHLGSHHDRNELGQPVNVRVPAWAPPPTPPRTMLEGYFCRVEPLDPAIHAKSLWEANRQDREGRMWTYLPFGPFETFESYYSWLEARCKLNDPSTYAIVDAAANRAIGTASYKQINAPAGTIEVGSVVFSPLLQGTPIATEAMYLMMAHVFDLGYRRYEWKCNTLNAASHRAAQRLGFSFEGILRQDNVTKGRTHDSAVYSILNHEWGALRAIFQRWLAPENFDTDRRQRTRLSDLTRPLLHDVVDIRR